MLVIFRDLVVFFILHTVVRVVVVTTTGVVVRVVVTTTTGVVVRVVVTAGVVVRMVVDYSHSELALLSDRAWQRLTEVRLIVVEVEMGVDVPSGLTTFCHGKVELMGPHLISE